VPLTLIQCHRLWTSAIAFDKYHSFCDAANLSRHQEDGPRGGELSSNDYTVWKDFVLSRGAEIANANQRFELKLSDRHATRDIFEKDGERFEAMRISEDGNVTVWTTTKVWFIIKHGNLDNLIYLPRNPPPS
jgi:hypothetical protein